MSAQLQLVNASVASFGKTLFPWTIVRVSEVEHSVADFFYEDIKPRISDSAPKCELLSAQVGQEKNSLDNVDFSVPIIAVISSFGRYLKYSVTILQTASSSEAATTSLSSSALSQSADCVLLSTVIQPADQKTMKDKLFNDILQLLISVNVHIRINEIPIMKKLIVLLRNVFWHIDGHHYVFEQRAMAIPAFFSSFTGYNCPEWSKHRKRLTQNMSSDALQEFALELSTILHLGFWERPDWVELKSHFYSLLISLFSYAEYLVQKNKRVKRDHLASTPVRELSEHLHMKYIAPSSFESTSTSSLLPSLKAIEKDLCEWQFYQISCITHLLPSDRLQRHRVVNSIVTHGVSFPCMMLVYAPGSNIGNFHFMWKLPSDVEVVECFQRSQSAVEEAKKKIPKFHSRAMRSALFQKFGRVSSGVKPSVLRFFYKELTGKKCIHDFQL